MNMPPEEFAGLIDFEDDDSSPGVDIDNYMDTETDDDSSDNDTPEEKFFSIEDEEEDEEAEQPPASEETPPADDKQPPADNRTPEQLEQDRLNAERRRQEKFQEQLKQSPEYELAQTLSTIYGKPVNEIITQLKEAQLKKQAEERQLPIEVIRKEQEREERLNRQEQELQRLQFQMWQNRIDAEQTQLQTTYPMLSEADFIAAKAYLLSELKNPELPLDKAVVALHGQKIISAIRESARNEALAEVSGRKKSPIPPKSSGAEDKPTLTDEERHIARAMGVSDAEYIKWK